MKSFFKSLHNFLVIFVLLSLLYSGVALARELEINNAQELIDFAKKVNDGTTYSGYTVYLDADIEFNSTLSQEMTPISNFVGTFDGQGHVISSLTISASSPYAGLFGYSEGLTLRNVILDSSCSITCSHSSSSLTFVAGLTAFCYAVKQPCLIENLINKAKVTFTGSISNELRMGGISSGVRVRMYGNTIRNCINYGTVEDKGSYSYNQIGGIVATCDSEQAAFYNNLVNCVNFGSILVNSKTVGSSNSRVGGIVGGTNIVNIKNCLS